jgi:hypothetical protein
VHLRRARKKKGCSLPCWARGGGLLVALTSPSLLSCFSSIGRKLKGGREASPPFLFSSSQINAFLYCCLHYCRFNISVIAMWRHVGAYTHTHTRLTKRKEKGKKSVRKEGNSNGPETLNLPSFLFEKEYTYMCVCVCSAARTEQSAVTAPLFVFSFL